jgi:hypothetical protein
MTIQNRQYVNSIQGLHEAKEQTLTVLFKTDEQMMERIYDLDFRQKFGKLDGNLHRDTKYIKKGNFRGFEVVFKGEKRELEKVIKYITGKLDKKNGIYQSHKIK